MECDQNNEILNMVHQVVELHGSQAAMYSAECIMHLMEHEDCKECKYIVGCWKLAVIYNLIQVVSVYEPESFLDFWETCTEAGKQVQEVLGIKTLEEVLQWVA